MATQLLISPTRAGTVNIISGNTTISGNNTVFKSSDVGKQIVIRTDVGDFSFVIATFTNATSVTLNVAPTVTQNECFFTINWYECDLYDDFPYSLNYNIADIRQPDKRNSSFTKTIKIPGTKENNIVFGHIFEIDIDGSFNPNLRADAQLLVDTVQVMRGNLQLLQINRLGDRIEYEVAVYGKVGDLFLTIGDKLITDLDWSDLDHYATKANVENSWTATVGDNYVYPLVDNGLQNFDTSSPAFSLKDLMPSVYVKEVIDRIFAAAGYTYSSAFLTSNFFKRLIVPASKIYRREAQFNYSIAVTVPVTDDDGDSVDDDIVVYAFLIKQDKVGARTFHSNNTAAPGFDILDFVCSTDPILVSAGGTVTLTPNFGVISIADMTDGDRVFVAVGAHNNATNSGLSAPLSFAASGSFSAIYDMADFQNDGSFTATRTVTSNPLTGSFSVNDQGHFAYGFVWDTVTSDPSGTYSNSTGIHTVPKFTFRETLWKNVEQRDFFMSIVKMFNLYVEPDKYNPTLIYVEPREVYYSTGVTVDWTSKLDLSQEIQVKPMAELDWKSYNFSYKEDKDWLNDKYETQFQEIYGQKKVDAKNDFLTQIKDIGIIFSPTPSTGSIHNDLVLPCILETGSGVTPDNYYGNPRILYYGGMKAGGWRLRYSTASNGYAPISPLQPPSHGSSGGGIGTGFNPKPYTFEDYENKVYDTSASYPYAGHLDDPGYFAQPTVDILWEQPKKIYWEFRSTYTYPTSNLFDYWSNFIGAVTDKDSKMVTAWFRLRPTDIYNLSFRDAYFIDGHWFRLNKIYDYNPNADTITKCEFIKINEAVAYSNLAVVGHLQRLEPRGRLVGVTLDVTSANISNLSLAQLGVGMGILPSGISSTALGNFSIATGETSIATGLGSLASLYNQQSQGAMLLTPGDAQGSSVVLSGVTAGDTQTELLLPNGGQIVLKDYSAVKIDAEVVGFRPDTVEAVGMKLMAMFKRGSGDASIVRMSTPTQMVLGIDDSTWLVDLDADTSTGAVRILVTGPGGSPDPVVAWSASVKMQEIWTGDWTQEGIDSLTVLP